MTTDAPAAIVQTRNDVYSYSATSAIFGVRINGTYDATYSASKLGSENIQVSLGAGTKTVELITSAGQAAQDDGGTEYGLYFKKVQFFGKATNIKRILSDCLVVYGDSIAAGTAASPILDTSWFMLLRAARAGKSTLSRGHGSKRLFQNASTEAKRTAFVNWLTSFSPATLWIAIGTNDYGGTTGNIWGAADFGAGYGALLDAIHAALPALSIYCQTPLVRNNETNTNTFGDDLSDYRAEIATACGTRAWATLVDGTGAAFPQLTDLADGLHPTTAGHTKYAAAVKTVLGIT